MKEPSHITPQPLRVIVTLGGAAIFIQSLISVLGSLLKFEIPDPVVAIFSFAMGAAVTAWVLHRNGSHTG